MEVQGADSERQRVDGVWRSGVWFMDHGSWIIAQSFDSIILCDLCVPLRSLRYSGKICREGGKGGKKLLIFYEQLTTIN